MKKLVLTLGFIAFLFTTACSPDKSVREEAPSTTEKEEDAATTSKIPVLFDTDANNELDDQHAMAYLFFNEDVFETVGVTVNATPNGGDITEQYKEAERIMKLCDVAERIPLIAGANDNFEDILPHIKEADFDGKKAVDLIIAEARKPREQKLVLLPVGKLTNIALALAIAPDIKEKVKIVWLGSNYPDKGEYNLVADIPSMNYVLEQEVPFEMVTVRYGKPSGTDAVKVTPDEIKQKMIGKGPVVSPVTGRHNGTFTTFGDYSVSLFENIDLHGDPPGRALFDMVAVAILKNESWGEKKEISCPTMIQEEWKELPENTRKITVWENFDKAAILKDFFSVMDRS